MEFEDQVARTLEAYGYPIFYRNLRLRYNRSDIAELDIVSTNFIVEVKSGQFATTKGGGFNVFYRHNLLPIEYIYFVYSPKTSDADLLTLQSMYGRNPNYRFINNLEQILTTVPPVWSASVTDHVILRNLICHTPHLLEKFSQLYVSRAAFDHVLMWLLFREEYCHEATNISNMELLRGLVERRVIRFEPAPPFTYPLCSGTNPLRKYHLHCLQPLRLAPCYYMKDLVNAASGKLWSPQVRNDHTTLLRDCGQRPLHRRRPPVVSGQRDGALRILP